MESGGRNQRWSQVGGVRGGVRWKSQRWSQVGGVTSGQSQLGRALPPGRSHIFMVGGVVRYSGQSQVGGVSGGWSHKRAESRHYYTDNMWYVWLGPSR